MFNSVEADTLCVRFIFLIDYLSAWLKSKPYMFAKTVAQVHRSGQANALLAMNGTPT